VGKWLIFKKVGLKPEITLKTRLRIEMTLTLGFKAEMAFPFVIAI
jgi:hypothetical protein